MRMFPTTTKVIRSPAAAAAEPEGASIAAAQAQAQARFLAVPAGSPAFEAARRAMPDATIIRLTAEQGQQLASLLREATTRGDRYVAAAQELERMMTAYRSSVNGRRSIGGGVVARLCRAALVQAWERTLAARRGLVSIVDEAPPELRPALDAALRAAGHWPVAPIPQAVVTFLTRLSLFTA